MKEFASDPALKQHMKEIAPIVPRIIKALTKVSAERKANMSKIGEVNEKAILDATTAFLKDRFNAQIKVYSESDEKRFDPKHRSAMAMPYQPAIYVE
jgi:hypothetical protein